MRQIGDCMYSVWTVNICVLMRQKTCAFACVVGMMPNVKTLQCKMMTNLCVLGLVGTLASFSSAVVLSKCTFEVLVMQSVSFIVPSMVF